VCRLAARPQVYTWAERPAACTAAACTRAAAPLIPVAVPADRAAPSPLVALVAKAAANRQRALRAAAGPLEAQEATAAVDRPPGLEAAAAAAAVRPPEAQAVKAAASRRPALREAAAGRRLAGQRAVEAAAPGCRPTLLAKAVGAGPAVAAAPSRRSHLVGSILAVSGSRLVSFLRRAAIASSGPLPPLTFDRWNYKGRQHPRQHARLSI
jgi:hypothetical protein